MESFALFDTNATMVRDVKDISDYVAESIRNIYGIIVEVKLDNYKGMTSKEVADAVLRNYGLDNAEIKARLDRYLEDLPYSYYNVAWSDKVVLLDGAKQILDTVKRKEAKIGIVTGEPERVTKMRLDKVGLSEYFEFGAYAEAGYSAREIVGKALDKVTGEFGLETNRGFMVTSIPQFVTAAKELGLYSIGVVQGEKDRKQALEEAGANELINTLKDKPKGLSRI